MTEHHHAIVWIDHREARIFHVSATEADREIVTSNATRHHLQHKANITGSGHRGVDKEYFKRVIAALTHTGALLIAGPANTRLELKNYIAEHELELAKRIAAVEPLDHPSDRELIALARKFFKADDEMHTQPA